MCSGDGGVQDEKERHERSLEIIKRDWDLRGCFGLVNLPFPIQQL